MFSQKTSRLIFLQRTFLHIYPELQNSVRERELLVGSIAAQNKVGVLLVGVFIFLFVYLMTGPGQFQGNS